MFVGPGSILFVSARKACQPIASARPQHEVLLREKHSEELRLQQEARLRTRLPRGNGVVKLQDVLNEYQDV